VPKDIGGVEVETVADIMGDQPSLYSEVETALEMPVLPTTPPQPQVGIHFGMSEEEYHALPCASKTHLRNMMCSPTLFWAESWLNRDRKEKDKEHLQVGKAYHAIVLEGPDAYNARFYPAPNPADYPNALRLADDIKQALLKRDEKPLTRVDVPGQEGKTRAATKDDWVRQLVRADRSVEVWDDIVAKAQQIAAGRTLLSVDDDRRIRMAARMIANDPQLAKAFKGGYPEVVLVWRDPRQGVLMKARVDYLKLKAVVDLKSFANTRDRSVRRAILHTIAEYKYSLQPAVYLQGVDEVRKLVRKHGASAVHFHDTDQTFADVGTVDRLDAERLTWALRWASNTTPDRWLWVFQQKGDAPVTRGFYHPLGGTHHAIACNMISDALRQFRACAETYGNEAWLDLAEIDDIEEEEIPMWGLDI
jgi:hypothetical protein